MGSSQSTHTVNIDNDELSTIGVSKSVADRLTKGLSDTPTTIGDSPKQERKMENVSNYIPSSVPTSNTQYVTSLDIQKHVHNAIDENNKYWESKIKNINAHDEKIRALMNKEYEKTLKEVEVILPHVNKEKKEIPCLNLKEDIMNCYKKNTKSGLNCIEHVNKFTSCILDTKA